MRLLLFLFLFSPLVVFAQEIMPLSVDIDSDEFSDLVFSVPQGTEHNLGLIITNTSNDSVDIRVHTQAVGDDADNSFVQTRFFDDTLPDVLHESLIANNDDIVTFCTKEQEDAVHTWCEGLDDIMLTITPDESVRVPMVITIDDDARDDELQLVIEQKNGDEYSVFSEYNIVYTVPDKDITQVDIIQFGIDVASVPRDIFNWVRTGMRDQYVAHIIVHNTGTEDADYTYYTDITSSWPGRDAHFEQSGHILPGEKSEHTLTIKIPRIGKVHIVGGVYYNDSQDTLQNSVSEPIIFFVWPLKLFFVCGGVICFCGVSVLLCKYIKKNMFGRKKKKKEIIYNGTYTVQDADNIISIAQRYDIPWKELAQYNEIEPPYILISGETIHVPDQSDDNKHVVEEQFAMSPDNAKQADVPEVVVKKEEQGELQSSQETISRVGDIHANSPQAVASHMATVSQKIPAQELVDETAAEPKVAATQDSKRKITFASPKNMLTKPSSEPTTRAIDIEWMRDDEAAYMEEMEIQEKKTSIRLIAISGFITLIVGACVWWGVMQLLQKKDTENVSVDTLIAQDYGAVQEDTMMTNTQMENDDNAIDDAQENQEEDMVEEDVQEVDKADITVQVLNAGAQVGAAGDVSDAFADIGFNVHTAQNSQNDYTDVTIYYNSAYKDIAESEAKSIDEKYGTQTIEESDDVTKKYDADIVIVLGS